jgi:hypothetical protein
VFNLSAGSGVCVCFDSKAHLPTSAPLSGPGTRPGIRPVIRQPPGGVPDPAVRRFPAAFPPPAFASWAPCPARRSSAPITVGRPPQMRTPATDPGRVSTFHTRETRTGPGALFTPGMTVFAGHRVVRGRRLPPHNGRSLPPQCYVPARDVGVTRHQQEFPDSRPLPVLPLTCDRHGWDDGPWAFPWASHPTDQEPATHATVGTRSNTNPELRLRHPSNLLHELTHNVRLRVATTSTGPTEHSRSARRPIRQDRQPTDRREGIDRASCIAGQTAAPGKRLHNSRAANRDSQLH